MCCHGDIVALCGRCLNEHVLLILHRAGIPFETEEQLRERGTSKTPDVLLSTPVAVQVKRPAGSTTSTQTADDDDGWRIVCWIDSKV